MPRDSIRILVVDDDEAYAALLSGTLRRMYGYSVSVDVLRSADAGRLALLEGGYDVCLLDYRLGDGNGMAVLREVRNLKLKTAIVFLTAHDDLPLELEALKLGADEYLEKDPPVTGRVLERAVRSAIERRRLRLESHAAEWARAASERQLGYILEWTTHLVYEWNLETNDLDFTGDVDGFLGYAPGAFPRTFEAWEAAVVPEDLPRLQAAIQQHLAGDRPEFLEEYRVQRRDGTHRSWLDRGRITRGAGGERVRWIGIIADVTDQRRLAEQVKGTQRLEALGRLAGGIAHDFNNLITVMVGYLALVMDKIPENSPEAEDLRQVYAAAERASGLTNQLLAFSRRQLLDPTVFSLNDAVRTVSGMLTRTIGEDVQLSTDLAGDLPAVRADPGQIEQVLLNLALNGRDAMPHGGRLTISTSSQTVTPGSSTTTPPTAPGDYVVLSVRDTGSGIGPEILKHIFEPFFTTKERGRGTGLGLAMVYGIVKQSGGYIWVDTAVGMGTTFIIYLPAVVEDERPGAEDAIVYEVAARPDLARKRLLVIEDDPAIRDLTVTVLRQSGYQVESAADGQEALRRAASAQRFDLVLADVILTDMNGIEAAEQVKGILGEVEVAFMSGYTEDAFANRLPEGMRLLRKPFTPRALLRFVEDSFV